MLGYLDCILRCFQMLGCVIIFVGYWDFLVETLARFIWEFKGIQNGVFIGGSFLRFGFWVRFFFSSIYVFFNGEF